MGYGLYLYGILPAQSLKNLRLQGLDQQPVHTHILDGFALLYSEAQQERYLASRRNLLGHEKVLETAMQQGYRTLLPLQFGLIVTDWESVHQELIIPYHQSLKKLLAKLEGQREVGIKVFWDAPAELQALLEKNEPLRAKRDRLEGKQLSMDQVIEIGQEIEQALQNRQQEIIEIFQTHLNPLATDIVENELLTDKMIYNAAYLIPWDTEAIFSEKVDAVDRHLHGQLRIRYNNFTAPFNFANLERL